MKRSAAYVSALRITWALVIPLYGCDSGTLRALPTPLPTVFSADPVEQAGKLITQMADGEFETGVASFDDTMRSSLPAETVEMGWAQLIAQFGAYVSQVEARTSKADGYDIVVITIRFERWLQDARVVLSEQGLVTGLSFGPSTRTLIPQPTYSPPVYADRGAFTEREVTIGAEGKEALTGTLSIPKGDGPFSGVVLVHGSGPNDRDETLGPNKPFRDLAWGLASRGIAVLRYDKRTFTYGQTIAALVDGITVKEEVVDDASAAVRVLQSTENVEPSKVYLLGHSLGAYLAPMVARQSPGVAGLVLMAGITRPAEDIIVQQATYLAELDGSISPEEQKELAKVKEQVAKLKDPGLSLDTPASELPEGIPAAYWLSIRGYQPGDEANDLDKPVLVLQGDRDYPGTLDDFEGWRKALSPMNATLKLYPSLNHLFMWGTEKPAPKEYFIPGNVAEEVIDDIAVWLKTR